MTLSPAQKRWLAKEWLIFLLATVGIPIALVPIAILLGFSVLPLLGVAPLFPAFYLLVCAVRMTAWAIQELRSSRAAD